MSLLFIPFDFSSCNILQANSKAVKFSPLMLFFGFENRLNLHDPLTVLSAPDSTKYFTTVGIPRADAIINGYNSVPTVEVEHAVFDVAFPPGPCIVTFLLDENSALGTLGFAPYSSIKSLMHLRIAPS
jgi:hypothetical protein